jgi:hypothetical protein
MEQAEALIHNLLTREEYVVYEHWIYSTPDRNAVFALWGDQMNNVKKRIRYKLHRDDVLREIFGLLPFDETPQ